MQDSHVKLSPGFPRKSSIQHEEDSSHQQNGLRFKEETINPYRTNVENRVSS